MKTFNGKVVKNSMEKTATVEISRTTYHSLYSVRMMKSKKFKCDTGDFKVFIGDTVTIGEVKPISKDKHFKIVKVISTKGEDR